MSKLTKDEQLFLFSSIQNFYAIDIIRELLNEKPNVIAASLFCMVDRKLKSMSNDEKIELVARCKEDINDDMLRGFNNE